MIDLELCPFCGSHNVKMCSDRDKRNHTIHFGKCLDCGAMGPELRSYEKAAEAWNHRAARHGGGD